MNTLERSLTVLVIATLIACGRSPDSQATAAGTGEGNNSPRLLASADGDSCMKISPRPISANYANPAEAPPDPPVAPGRWDSVVTVTTPQFAIDVPAVAAARMDSASSGWSFSPLPICGIRCNLGVRVFADGANKGVEAFVAALLREEARIDSLNADPNTAVREFNHWRGPAEKTATFDTIGLLLDGDCGDCSTVSLFVGRPGQIAEVSYGIDQVPDAARRECQLRRAATSFRWRP